MNDSHSLTAEHPGRPSAGTLLPLLAIWGAVLFWGGSFSAMKSALAWLGPREVMWVRMSVALLVLVPFGRSLWPRRYRSGDWKLLLPLVLFMPCLYFLLESNALTLTTSSQAGVISSSVPLLVAAGAWIFFGDRLTIRVLVGLAMSMGGVAWLTLAGAPSASASNPLLGNLLEVGAMVCAAGYMLVVKKLSDRYNPWTLTALQTVVGWLFFLPGAPGVVRALPQVMDSGIWLQLIYLGSFVTLGAFGLFNWGMSRIPVGVASIYINLVPVVAVFFGWTLLGESLNGVQLLAAACVFAGVWLSRNRE